MFFVNIITASEIFSLPLKQSWLWLSAAAILGFVLGNYFSLMHIKEAGEKLNSLLSPAITALTIVLSYFFLHDKLEVYQCICIAVTLFAIVLFLLKQGEIKSRGEIYRPVLSGIATIICISLTIICTIKGAGNLPYLLAIWLRLFIAFIILLPAFIISNKAKIVLPKGISFYGAILIGVLAQTIGAAYLWLYASFHISVSVFQIILATLPLFMYAIDVYLFKKTKSSFYFLATALLAGVGIAICML